MSDLPISKRLEKIASYVPVCKQIADIGTDHGYLAAYLLQKNQCEKAICCDINKKPLESAKNTFETYGKNLSVEFRLGSGIEPIESGEVEVAVVAGMGGGLIQSILSQDLSKSHLIPIYVLQPQTEQAQLRKWLISNNFKICFDAYIKEDGKYYELMVVTSMKAPVLACDCIETYKVSNDLEFGYCVPDSEWDDYTEFLNHKREKYHKILNALPEKPDTLLKRNLCLEKLSKIESILRRS